MVEEKYVHALPPEDLLRALEMLGAHPSQRTGQEMWEIGERILRKDGLWPKNPLKRSTSFIGYNPTDEEAYGLCYTRRNFMEDFMIVNNFGENTIDVAIHRERGHSLLQITEKKKHFTSWGMQKATKIKWLRQISHIDISTKAGSSRYEI